MSSNLQKIQLTYDQANDRLILNFNTQDFFEYRFWITRRVLKGFWNLLQQLAQGFPKDQMQKLYEAQHADEKIHKEVQIAEASKYSTRMTRHPLGEEPSLLYKIMATPGEKGGVHFHLEDSQGRSVDFKGDAFLVVLLTQLILKILPLTDWGLQFTPGTLTN